MGQFGSILGLVVYKTRLEYGQKHVGQVNIQLLWYIILKKKMENE